MSNAKPVITLKDGLISAAIWRNKAEDGTLRYSVSFARAYLKDDEWRSSHSYSRAELLRLARLSERAYDWIASQVTKDRAPKSRKKAA